MGSSNIQTQGRLPPKSPDRSCQTSFQQVPEDSGCAPPAPACRTHRQICCSRARLFALHADCQGSKCEDRAGAVGGAVSDHQHHSLKKLSYDKLLLQSARACIRQPSACRGSSMSQRSQQMIQHKQAAMPASICVLKPFVMLIASNFDTFAMPAQCGTSLSSRSSSRRLLHYCWLLALHVIPYNAQCVNSMVSTYISASFIVCALTGQGGSASVESKECWW